MVYKKENKNSKTSPENLRDFIRDGIVEAVREDRIELTLPWHFGPDAASESAPLTLTIRPIRARSFGAEVQKMRAKGYSVDDTDYPEYRIDDGGRCLDELKIRLGDISPYIPKIKRVLYNCGMLELSSGHIITRSYSAYSSYRHIRELNAVLTAISVISNVDLFLAVDGEEWKDGDTHDA